jgi:predicted DNA-binding transcriptional regulator AlpA
MPSAPIRNAAIPNPSDMKNDDQSFPSSSPQSIMRGLYPQKSAGTGQNGIASNIDEVTFLRLPGVKEITGLSKSSLYALIQEKSFPAPVRLGARTVAWVRSEVRQWALERIRASR